jgi:tRNA-modifying protein YgfZ
MFSHDGYHALYDGAALLDRRAARGRLELIGADRRSYLHGLLTNDITALMAGTGCYAALLTPQGRMISDMRVSELPDRLIIDLPSATSEAVRQRLADFIFSEDVEVRDVSADLGHWGLYGPQAEEVAAAVFGATTGVTGRGERLASMPDNGNVEWSFGGQPAVLIRSSDFGRRGFEILTAASGELLVQALVEAGAIRIDDETAEVSRLEAGVPAFGTDMDATTIPLEAGIEDRAISLTKGCYVGQEIIIRVLHRGHGRVARRLVGMIGAAGEGPLLAGMRLEAGGRDVGTITSAVESPRLKRPIALGYVHRDHSEAGNVLDVRHGDDPLRSVTVVTTPFVQPATE